MLCISSDVMSETMQSQLNAPRKNSAGDLLWPASFAGDRVDRLAHGQRIGQSRNTATLPKTGLSVFPW